MAIKGQRGNDMQAWGRKSRENRSKQGKEHSCARFRWKVKTTRCGSRKRWQEGAEDGPEGKPKQTDETGRLRRFPPDNVDYSPVISSLSIKVRSIRKGKGEKMTSTRQQPSRERNRREKGRR